MRAVPCAIAKPDGEIGEPRDLLNLPLLRSYRADEWPRWFRTAGIASPPLHGIMFDSSLAMVEAAMQGAGVALAPAAMFTRQLEEERLKRPFAQEIGVGRYWLTWLKSRAPTPAMTAFQDWLLAKVA